MSTKIPTMAATTKRRSLASMDATKLFHVVGLISAVTLGIGFVAGVISVGLSWRISQQEKVEIEKLKEGNLATEERLGKEQDKRLKLEMSLARREIPWVWKGDGTSNWDSLKPFAGINVIIEYLPNDIETRRAFPVVEEVMRRMGWNILSVKPNPLLENPMWDGVTVGSYMPTIPPETPLKERLAKQQASTDDLHAAEALIAFLESYNWEAKSHPDMSDGLPPNTIRVCVGFKSLPRVVSEEFQKAIEAPAKNKVIVR